jgi:hypothetical protein
LERAICGGPVPVDLLGELVHRQRLVRFDEEPEHLAVEVVQTVETVQQ